MVAASAPSKPLRIVCGASGLKAIKDCGGVALVQDPLESEADEMPLAALEATVPDAVLPPDELAGTIDEAPSRRSRCAGWKLETPMARVRPSAYSFSSARHVSR